jgi:hypothetical protein
LAGSVYRALGKQIQEPISSTAKVLNATSSMDDGNASLGGFIVNNMEDTGFVFSVLAQ